MSATKAAVPGSVFENHLAVVGKTGSGKTYTAKGFVEHLLAGKQRVCIIDPTGVWWGLRSKADGKKAAYPVVVFGGAHADMPLLATQGEAMAEIIGGTDMSAVIDTSDMTVADRTKFFTAFAEALMRKNKGPLNFVIDEAHNFMPQGKVLSPQAGQMLAAGNELLSGGRARGLRVTLITQRPQKLHKDSLTQAETLIAMRLIAPHDRKAVAEWMKAQADDESHATKILNSLPGLKTGEGWVWSPESGLLKQMKFPRITTYDSSKAPDGSETSVVLAKVNLPEIEKRLGEYAAEAKNNDPKALRARIAELEKVQKKWIDTAEHDPKAYQTAFDNGVKQGYQRGMHDAVENSIKQLDYIAGCVLALSQDAKNLHGNIQAITAKLKGGQGKPVALKAVPEPRERSRANKPVLTLAQQIRHDRANMRAKGGTPKGFAPKPLNPGSTDIGAGHRKILAVLAQYPNGRNLRQIGLLSGYASGGGSFRTYMSKLRTAGYVEQNPGQDMYRITPEGLEALGSYEPLPTGAGLQSYWLNQLGAGPRAILSSLINAYPGELSMEDIGQATGYAHNGGSFRTYLSKLRTLELVESMGGNLRAAAELF